VLKILVVDDHPLIRTGLRELLRGMEERVDVMEASSATAALELLDRGLDADLLLLDINLPDMSGLELLERLGERHADLPVVVLSGDKDRAVMHAAFARGAAGFVHKTSLAELIVPALRLVLAGGIYQPPEMLQPEPAARGPGITPRQHEVLRRMLAGLSNKDIARELALSEATVKAHTTAILRALGVRSRTQAVIVATRLGYVRDDTR
jgi:DNA-binding NarL/FixJ family response regulator